MGDEKCKNLRLQMRMNGRHFLFHQSLQHQHIRLEAKRRRKIEKNLQPKMKVMQR